MKMKKLSILLALTVLLMSGQSSAVAASVPTDTVKLDQSGLDVSFRFVGTNSLEADRITASKYGTYDVVADNSGYGSITLKANYWGTTMRSDTYNYTGLNTFNATGNDEYYTYQGVTVGSLFLIVDGSVTLMGGGISGVNGVFEGLALGDHTLTLLWCNQEDDGTFLYATDTITVRVRESADDFGEFRQTELPFVYDVDDTAVEGANVSLPLIYWNPTWGDYYRNVTYEAPVDVTLKAGTTTLASGDQIDTENPPTITMSGTTDSTGQSGDATAGLSYGYGPSSPYTNATVGRSFLVDSRGLTLVDDAEVVTIRDGERDKGFEGYTFVGLLTLADGGIFWYGEIYGSAPDDLEGIETVAGVDIEYSVDFVFGMDGNYVKGKVHYEQFTLTNQEIITITTTTTEESSPFDGLSALLGLFAIGTLAYAIPRKFKK
jgi:hypothetical protein